MYYKQFLKRIDEEKETFISFGKVAHFKNGSLTIDGNTIDKKFESLDEAKNYCKDIHDTHQLEEDIKNDTYNDQDTSIANIIKETHNIKVTNTIVESYKELALSKLFSIDPVVTEIRKLNKLDTIVEGKIDYKLNDSSLIAINEETQNRLNNLLKDQNDIIEHMRKNKENFMHVLKLIQSEE